MTHLIIIRPFYAGIRSRIASRLYLNFFTLYIKEKVTKKSVTGLIFPDVIFERALGTISL
jgi:hypothetical protein